MTAKSQNGMISAGRIHAFLVIGESDIKTDSHRRLLDLLQKCFEAGYRQALQDEGMPVTINRKELTYGR